MKKGRLAVDGASKGNPGPAGIGVVIYDESGKIVKEISEYIGENTNNVAEYSALIRGLKEAADLDFTELAVQTDSELMAKQINGQYSVKNGGIIPLYGEVMSLTRNFRAVTVKHVLRSMNKEADKLASAAAMSKGQPQQPALLLEEPAPKPTKPSKAAAQSECNAEGAKMIHRIPVRTSSRSQFVDITRDVQEAVTASSVRDGMCTIFIPHTTAGVTINENADPDVTRDLIDTLNGLVPESKNYRHVEGNSDSHLKASMMGFTVNVFVEAGRLVLGTWQGIYFCEFDGPRSRHAYVKVMKDC